MVICFFIVPLPAQGEDVFYFQTDSRYDYRTELLRHALSYSQSATADSKASKFTLKPLLEMPSARGQALLKQGKLNAVVSLATNKSRERDYRAIKIPILAGVLGMRVLLIREQQQWHFREISTLDSLSKISAGFVSHWGDMKILKDNGLKVVEAARYETLFPMLSAGRFDYFPRGVNEIEKEYATYGARHNNIMIERHIAVFYPYPVYFFVNKQQALLAETIESGLKEAIADGSFKALFLEYHEQLLDRLNFNARTIITIENTDLPEGTSFPDMSWWLNDDSCCSKLTERSRK